METGFLFRGSNLRVGCQQSGCSKKHYVHCEKSMSIVYLVRKKVFRTAEGVKQLYYAVQRVLQRRGGVTAELLAQRMASRKGMSSGDVQSVLIDLPKFIEEALMTPICEL